MCECSLRSQGVTESLCSQWGINLRTLVHLGGRKVIADVLCCSQVSEHALWNHNLRRDALPISNFFSLCLSALLWIELLWWFRSAFWQHSQKGCKVCILGSVFPLINYRASESVTGWMCSNLSHLKADRVSGTFIQCLLKGAVTLQENLCLKEHTFPYLFTVVYKYTQINTDI